MSSWPPDKPLTHRLNSLQRGLLLAALETYQRICPAHLMLEIIELIGWAKTAQYLQE